MQRLCDDRLVAADTGPAGLYRLTTAVATMLYMRLATRGDYRFFVGAA